MSRLSTLLFRVAIIVVLIWLCGQVLSDRWFWSQWLVWIPTFAIGVLLFCVTGMLLWLKKKRDAIITATVFITITTWFLFVENHILSTPGGRADLRIAVWTMSHSKKSVSERSANLIIELDADITLMTHGWYVRGEPAIKKWLGTKGKRLISGPFTLLTSMRPIEVRTLVASGGMYISMFRLDTTKEIGRELVVYAVDFPSSISKSRLATARRAKRLLRQVDAPLPDIVMGDFNMTRNSASIKRLFPALSDAWDSAGVGWSSTYHRAFPLYHIDHILLDDAIHAGTYQLVDPNVGRHRIQLVDIAQ